jgi:hypothetical protein
VKERLRVRTGPNIFCPAKIRPSMKGTHTRLFELDAVRVNRPGLRRYDGVYIAIFNHRISTFPRVHCDQAVLAVNTFPFLSTKPLADDKLVEIGRKSVKNTYIGERCIGRVLENIYKALKDKGRPSCRSSCSLGQCNDISRAERSRQVTTPSHHLYS